jgi:hypothetical protein
MYGTVPALCSAFSLPFVYSAETGTNIPKKMLLGLAFCSSGRILGKSFTDGGEFHADGPR